MPVLVKVSYFPNWEVSGAEGPYRIAPNLMVVVPTSTDVHLTYERSTLDYFAYLLTLLGIVLLIFMRIRGDVRHANTHPFGSASDSSTASSGTTGTSRHRRAVLVDPTPSEPMACRHRRPAGQPISIAESLVWASPTATSAGRLRPSRR